MEELHTTLAPCEHLPSEILAEIFILCLDWHKSLGRSLRISTGPWGEPQAPSATGP